MNLKKYDKKYAKITTIFNEIYEGYCEYNSEEYNFHEFGTEEEGLQIANTLFYKSIIKKIESLENHQGPYGHFTEKYGRIEKEIVEDGIDTISDIFISEEIEHIYRILIYLEEHINNDKTFQKELIKSLNEVLKYHTEEKIIKETKKLLNIYNKSQN